MISVRPLQTRTFLEKYPEIISFLLIGLVLAVFAEVRYFDFITLDDSIYVWTNPHITQGLTWEGIRWAFGADLFFDAKNADYWQPLTFISRMIDMQIFGLNAGGHHVMNVGLHIINVILLFSWLRSLTGSYAKAAFVAALFAVHPLQVEPVAWITARKDILSGLFALLTLRHYTGYIEKPSKSRYRIVLLLFILSLMCKPAMIVLPFLMLTLDYKPFDRIRFSREALRANLKPITEKIPFFILIVPSCVITILVRQEALGYASPGVIALNILVTYARSVLIFLFPHKLILLSPQPLYVAPWTLVAASATFLVVLSLLFFRNAHRIPYLATGWLWFLISLFPSSNLSAPADRFMYFPIIGLIMCMTWLLIDTIEQCTPVFLRRIGPGILAFVLIGAASVRAHTQVGYWQDSGTLFRHAIHKTEGNYLAHLSLGSFLMMEETIDQTLEKQFYEKKLSGEAPVLAGASEEEFNRIAGEYETAEKWEEATHYYQMILDKHPKNPAILNSMGILLGKQKKFSEAIPFFLKALAAKPDFIDAHLNAALAYTGADEPDKAKEHYREALRIDPLQKQAHNNLAELFIKDRTFEEAALHIAEALKIDPHYSQAHYNLGIIQAVRARTWTSHDASDKNAPRA